MIDTQDAPLPPDCRIHYRLTDAQGRTREETEPMQLLGKVDGRAARKRDRRRWSSAVTGGDDRNMQWIAVQVIDPPEPPAVRSLTLKITPPRYTNWPEEEREATSTAAAAWPARACSLPARRPNGSSRRASCGWTTAAHLPIEIDGDGLTFHVGRPSPGAPAEPPHELIVEKSTGYTFRLIDVDGVEGGGDESWQFRVLTDAPPSVVIEQPAGDLFVTERAVVNFRVRARDDLALRQVVLVLSPSDAEGDEGKNRFSLHTDPTSLRPRPSRPSMRARRANK